MILEQSIEMGTYLDDNAFEKLEGNEINAVINSLPADYKLIFNRLEVDKMGHKNLAALLDITEPALLSLQKGARSIIQSKLKLKYPMFSHRPDKKDWRLRLYRYQLRRPLRDALEDSWKKVVERMKKD